MRNKKYSKMGKAILISSLTEANATDASFPCKLMQVSFSLDHCSIGTFRMITCTYYSFNFCRQSLLVGQCDGQNSGSQSEWL